MSTDRAEDRLRRRARERADESLLSDTARAETLVEIRALAARETMRRRAAWWSGAVAAGLLVLLIGTWTRGDAERGPAPVEVALLDAGLRELVSRTRSVDPDFVRPETLNVEVIPTRATFAAAFYYDPDGARHRIGNVWPVPTEEDFYFEVDLADVETHAGESRVTVVVLSATSPVDWETLEEVLPARFDDLTAEARPAAETELAQRLERELDCAAAVASFVLDAR